MSGTCRSARTRLIHPPTRQLGAYLQWFRAIYAEVGPFFLPRAHEQRKRLVRTPSLSSPRRLSRRRHTDWRCIRLATAYHHFVRSRRLLGQSGKPLQRHWEYPVQGRRHTLREGGQSAPVQTLNSRARDLVNAVAADCLCFARTPLIGRRGNPASARLSRGEIAIGHGRMRPKPAIRMHSELPRTRIGPQGNGSAPRRRGTDPGG